MKNLIAMTQLATECIQAGRADEALLHLGMLKSSLAKHQPVGHVERQAVEFISGPCANLHAVWVKGRSGPYIYGFADRDHEGQAKFQAEQLAQALSKLRLHC